MDNQQGQNGICAEDFIKFIGIGPTIAPIYRTDKLKNILEFMKSKKMDSSEKAFIIKRISKIVEIDNDIRSLCSIIEDVLDKYDSLRSNSKYSSIRAYLKNFFEKSGKTNISDLFFVLSLPDEHNLFRLVENNTVIAAIIRNRFSLLENIRSVNEMLDFSRNKFVRNNLESLSASGDYIQHLCDKWRELIATVNNKDELKKMLAGIDGEYRRCKMVIEQRMAEIAINNYQTSKSTIGLFQCYAMLEFSGNSREDIRYLLVDPACISKGLNDICEYMTQNGEKFVKDGELERIVRIFINSIRDIGVLSIYYTRIWNIEPNDSTLLSIIKARCADLISNVSIRQPEKWFQDYIKNPATIPDFLKNNFLEKAKDIIGA